MTSTGPGSLQLRVSLLKAEREAAVYRDAARTASIYASPLRHRSIRSTLGGNYPLCIIDTILTMIYSMYNQCLK